MMYGYYRSKIENELVCMEKNTKLDSKISVPFCSVSSKDNEKVKTSIQSRIEDNFFNDYYESLKNIDTTAVTYPNWEIRFRRGEPILMRERALFKIFKRYHQRYLRTLGNDEILLYYILGAKLYKLPYVFDTLQDWNLVPVYAALTFFVYNPAKYSTFVSKLPPVFVEMLEKYHILDSDVYKRQTGST